MAAVAASIRLWNLVPTFGVSDEPLYTDVVTRFHHFMVVENSGVSSTLSKHNYLSVKKSKCNCVRIKQIFWTKFETFKIKL